jgi:hypothetical protein
MIRDKQKKRSLVAHKGQFLLIKIAIAEGYLHGPASFTTSQHIK